MDLSVQRQTNSEKSVLALNASQSQTSITFSRKAIFMGKCLYAIKPKQLSNHFTELSLGIGKKLFAGDPKHFSGHCRL